MGFEFTFTGRNGWLATCFVGKEFGKKLGRYKYHYDTKSHKRNVEKT
jgi:hypothetical protein